MISKTAAFVICSFMALLIVFTAAFACVEVLLGWDGFFAASFRAADAEGATGIGMEDLMEVHRATAAFVRGDDVSLDIVCERYDGPIVFYKDDEIRHLEDVRDVFSRLSRAFAAACVITAAGAVSLFFQKENAPRYLKLISLLGIIYTFFGGLAFEPLFTALHRVLFPGGNWVFYPDISLMVNLYSEGVFIRCGAFIALTVIALEGLLWLLAGTIEKRGKRKWKKT